MAARTPLLVYPQPLEGRTLYLKPENLQPMGAFKLRGAYNKIASLSEDERKRGVISYSSGNHAQGVAYAARALGVRATIVMPRNAPQTKIDGTRSYGAEIVFVGPGSHERKAKAEELARERGLTIVPPYNDEQIIAGQGTVGLEILEDLADIEVVLSPVGGGGLISGIATAIKASKAKAKVIGVEPELANDAQRSLRAGRVVELAAEQVSQTLADGLRTQALGDVTFEHIRQYVDEIVTVSEKEMLAAVRALAVSGKLVVEPSGAVTAAAFMFGGDQLPRGKTVAVLSGGNIEAALLARILAGEDVTAKQVSTATHP